MLAETSSATASAITPNLAVLADASSAALLANTTNPAVFTDFRSAAIFAHSFEPAVLTEGGSPTSLAVTRTPAVLAHSPFWRAGQAAFLQHSVLAGAQFAVALCLGVLADVNAVTIFADTLDLIVLAICASTA